MDQIMLENDLKEYISNIFDEYSSDILSIKLALLSMEFCPYEIVSELVAESARYTEIEKLDILSIFFVDIDDNNPIERVESTDLLDDNKPKSRNSFSSLNSKEENDIDILGENHLE